MLVSLCPNCFEICFSGSPALIIVVALKCLYESGYMSKQDAYQWLADLIMAPLSEAHIGHLGEYYCKQVIEESRKLLER